MNKLPDDDELNPLDVLDITEDFMQSLNEKRQNAMNLQATAAIRAILDGIPPPEVAARCGFIPKEEQEHRLPADANQIIRFMMEAGPPQQDAVAAFSRWLCHWLHHQIVGFKDDCEGV